MSTANAKHAENRRKLTRAEKKEITALIRAAKGDGKAHTAQQTIPYLAMYPDGICKVTEKKYSKSIAYDDINYQLAQADDKTAIFENWCDFLNYFDATVSVQLSFVNRLLFTPGQATALPLFPLLCLDLYRHAYALTYGNDRTAYVEAALPLINWETLSQRYKTVYTAQPPFPNP